MNVFDGTFERRESMNVQCVHEYACMCACVYQHFYLFLSFDRCRRCACSTAVQPTLDAQNTPSSYRWTLTLSISSFNEFNDTIQTRFERKEAYVRHSIRTHCTVTLCYPYSSHSHIAMQTCMHERDHTIRVMRIIPLRFQKSKQSIDVAFVSRKRTKETKKNQNL